MGVFTIQISVYRAEQKMEISIYPVLIMIRMVLFQLPATQNLLSVLMVSKDMAFSHLVPMLPILMQIRKKRLLLPDYTILKVPERFTLLTHGLQVMI